MIPPGELQDALAARTVPGGQTWEELARAAAQAEGADWEEVLSWRRSPTSTRARHRAWWGLYDLGYSYPEIAAGWGADHTSIIYGVRKFAAGCGIVKPSRRPNRPTKAA